MDVPRFRALRALVPRRLATSANGRLRISRPFVKTAREGGLDRVVAFRFRLENPEQGRLAARLRGNPGLRAHDPGSIHKLRASRAAAHLDAVLT